MSVHPQPFSPHQGQRVLAAGAAPGAARAAMILIHGRGGSGAEMLGLAEELGGPGFRYFAPQAAGNVWYPNSFLAPLPSNEPYLSSALAFVSDVLTRVESDGLPASKTILLGFSQGACLALEFAARNPQRYGGVVALSGGLITPPESAPPEPGGALAGTPAFLGCSDRDMHIPEARVRDSASWMDAAGAAVTLRIYPGMGHTVIPDEIEFVQELMAAVAEG